MNNELFAHHYRGVGYDCFEDLWGIKDCRCCENLFLEGILVVISVRSVGSRKKTSTRKFVLQTTASSYKNKANKKKQKGFKYVKYCFFIEFSLRVKHFLGQSCSVSSIPMNPPEYCSSSGEFNIQSNSIQHMRYHTYTWT